MGSIQAEPGQEAILRIVEGGKVSGGGQGVFTR